jgi:hypothetical protein
MSMTTTALNKVAGEMAEYIQHSQDLIDNLQSENIALRKQASTQKTASAESPILDTDGVENMVDNLVEAKLLKEASRQQAIDAIKADPNALVDYMDKLATSSMEKQAAREVRPLGRKHNTDVQKTASSDRDSDTHFEELTRRLRARV